MAIPYVTLDTLCKKYLKEDLPSTLSLSPYANTISIRGDKMRIDADVFKNLFDKTVKNILTLLKELFKRKVESVALLLLVGGFSECTLLQAEIKKTFISESDVPEESSLTVLKGAVLFGHNSEVIFSRKTRVTGGVGCTPILIRKCDQQHYIERNDQQYCNGAFDIIMRKDTNVRKGTTVKKIYHSIKR
ncbi:unnamed protein product [Mytilus edulis]|uniref:Uncharacterized protein n=1 Tax=Mytilus edulis TaxID=6550 RepID=A0A8S3SD87_MYTED|nr:unnamed protein product [Mytilus edulis]